jgi:hypothetical protein
VTLIGCTVSGTYAITGSTRTYYGTDFLGPVASVGDSLEVDYGATFSQGIAANQPDGTTLLTSLAVGGGKADLGATAIKAANVSLVGDLVSGPLTVTKDMRWVGGTIGGGGVLTIAAGATMEISCGTLDGRTLRIEEGANALWTPQSASQGLYLDHGAVLDNEGLFTIDCECDVNLAGLGPDPSRTGTIENGGTLVKTGSGIIHGWGGWGIPGVELDGGHNSGKVEVDGGSLVLPLSGNNTGEIDVAEGAGLWVDGDGTMSGPINAQAHSSLEVSGNWTIMAPITSAGSVTFAGSAFDGGGATQVEATYKAASTTVTWYCNVTFAGDVTSSGGMSLSDYSNATFTGAVHSLGAWGHLASTAPAP